MGLLIAGLLIGNSPYSFIYFVLCICIQSNEWTKVVCLFSSSILYYQKPAEKSISISQNDILHPEFLEIVNRKFETNVQTLNSDVSVINTRKWQHQFKNVCSYWPPNLSSWYKGRTCLYFAPHKHHICKNIYKYNNESSLSDLCREHKKQTNLSIKYQNSTSPTWIIGVGQVWQSC